MTKHLRFLFVMLLAMIWSAGWAQTIVDFSNGLPTGWSNTGTVQKQMYQEKNSIQLQKNTTITSPAFEDAYSSMKISMTRSPKGKDFTISYQIGSASEVELKRFSETNVTKQSWKDYTVTIPAAAQVANCKFIFKSATSSYYISSIEFTPAGPTKTDTKVSFDENSGKTFTFTEGKYSNGTFTTPTATETTGVAGTIAYSSSNATAISVDSSTGALTFNGYGKATITATFTPNDTKKYAESTDSYIVENKAESINAAFYESFNNCDGKAGWSGSVADKPWDAEVFDNSGWTKTGKAYLGAECIRIGKDASSVITPVISLTGDAILTFMAGAWNKDNTTITVSVSDGTLTYGDNAPAKSVNIDLVQSTWVTYSMKISGTKSCKITFNNKTTSYRFFLDEVMVKNVSESGETTTITLDENSESNTIEAKTGVNVTLNRPMNVGRWNTFCVPFSIDANQVTSQFGEGTQIAEYSVSKSKDEVIAFATVQSNAIVAGKAYLVKPTKEAATEGYTFSNVNITALKPTKETVDNGAIDFRGIYNPTDITVGLPTKTFAAGIVGNVVKKAVSDSKMKGFRAFFIIPEGTGAQSSYMLKIDGTATSINSINGADVVVNAPVYNLQGQRVDGNNLTPGIYVKAGKKFVVK